MSLHAEAEALRRDLEKMSRDAEMSLIKRYELRFPPKERLSLYRRMRISVGRVLRWLRLRRTRPPEPWLTGLKHAEHSDGSAAFVIWALGADRDELRAACRGFVELQAALPGWVPVLVTDVADFAFFSRLGWLVEYVPGLSTPADGYGERKRRYLAWRYRDAPALPMSAGLAEFAQVQELLA